MTMPLSSSMCLNISYVKDSVLKLVSGILLIALALAAIIARRKNIQVSGIVVKIYAALFMVCLILMLISLR